ncbi:MAG: DUF2946 family protein [Betaproteobacteria bacterium]|nr:DUF2946 family protein [Betaproteobacteria bacterium]
MDEMVLRGMAKWPNVPAVYGWLSLDRRGEWRLKRERIGNPMVTVFIGRNYEHDERGCWYFQNGPQRVFVGLDYTPIVYRLVSAEGAPLELECHTGRRVYEIGGAWMDEAGALLLLTEHGVGLVHDRDLAWLVPCFVDADGRALAATALDERIEMVQRGRSAPLWLEHRGGNTRVEPVVSAEVPRRFGFVAEPQPPGGEEVCR